MPGMGRRRRPAAVLRASTWRGRPEPIQAHRVIKIAPWYLLGAPRARNRREEYSPEAETKGGVCGRKGGNSKIQPLQSKQPETEPSLSTTETTGRTRSKEQRKKAPGVPPSPCSSELNNGGEVDAGVWGLYEGSGCTQELRVSERKPEKEAGGLSSPDDGEQRHGRPRMPWLVQRATRATGAGERRLPGREGTLSI